MALKMHSSEAREKAEAARRHTIANHRKLADEDILICRRNGLVPLAIADRLGVSLRRVIRVMHEAGEPVPYYLITSGEPAREPCRRCGRR